MRKASFIVVMGVALGLATMPTSAGAQSARPISGTGTGDTQIAACSRARTWVTNMATSSNSHVVEFSACECTRHAESDDVWWECLVEGMVVRNRR